MKGYRLEDCGMGKLITLHDVCFVKDDLPSDTSVVDSRSI